MKRMIYLLSVFSLPCIFLTSCQVNWFDKQYDVPWWVIAIPVILWSIVIFAISFGFGGQHISKKLYTCPHCGKRFHPTWKQAVLSLHVNDDRLFKCPHCGQRSFCTPSYKQDEE